MVHEMIEWFVANYEQPVGNASRYNCDFYEARDVLSEQFDDAEEREIEEAVLLIESEGGSYWVKIADCNSTEDYEVGPLGENASPF